MHLNLFFQSACEGRLFFFDFSLKKNTYIMKEFFEIIGKDILKEDFTKREYIVYGVIAPLVLVALMAFAGWLDSLL